MDFVPTLSTVQYIKKNRNAQKVRENVVVEKKSAYVIYEWSPSYDNRDRSYDSRDNRDQSYDSRDRSYDSRDRGRGGLYSEREGDRKRSRSPRDRPNSNQRSDYRDQRRQKSPASPTRKKSIKSSIGAVVSRTSADSGPYDPMQLFKKSAMASQVRPRGVGSHRPAQRDPTPLVRPSMNYNYNP